jgi:hypothetical protein
MAEGGGDGGGVQAPGGAAEYQGMVPILMCFFLFGLNLLLRLPPPPTALPFSPAGVLPFGARREAAKGRGLSGLRVNV